MPAGNDTTPDFEVVWTDLERLADEIGAAWPEDVLAVEAVREQRRAS